MKQEPGSENRELRQRITALEQRVYELEKQQGIPTSPSILDSSPSVVQPIEIAEPLPEPDLETVEASPPTPIKIDAAHLATEPETPKPEPVPFNPQKYLKKAVAQKIKAEPEKQPEAARNNIENIIGGNLLNRLGILAILIGVGFLLKLAIDQGLITPGMRVIAGLVLGLGMIAVGEITQRKDYKKFAAGLFGGGLGVLYFSIYASFEFYHFITVEQAFFFECLVTLGGMGLAIRSGVLALALLAQIGGFLTPVMINSGVDRQMALFSYLVVFDLGMLFVAFLKEWRVLERIGWFGTAFLFFGWAVNHYSEEKFALTFFFLTLFYFIFFLVPIGRVVIRKISASAWDLFGLIALTSGYFGAACLFLEPKHENWIQYLGLFLAVLQGVCGWLMQTRSDPNKESRTAVAIAYGFAGIFFTFFLWKAFDGAMLTVALSIWACALSLLWSWTGLKALGFSSVAMHLWALLRLLIMHADPGYNYTIVANNRLLCYGAEALSLFALVGFNYWRQLRSGLTPTPSISKSNFPFAIAISLLALAVGAELSGVVSAEWGRAPWGFFALIPYPHQYLPFWNARFGLLLGTSVVLICGAFAWGMLFYRRSALGSTLFSTGLLFSFLAIAPEIAGLLTPSIGADPLRRLALYLPMESTQYLPFANGRAVFVALYAAFFLFAPTLYRAYQRLPLEGHNWKYKASFFIGLGIAFFAIAPELAGLFTHSLGANPLRLLLVLPSLSIEEYVPFLNARAAFLMTSVGFLAFTPAIYQRFFAQTLARDSKGRKAAVLIASLFGFFALAPELAGLFTPSVGAAPLRFFFLSLQIPEADYRFLFNGRAIFLAAYASFFFFAPWIKQKLTGEKTAIDSRISQLLGTFALLVLCSSEVLGIMSHAAASNPWEALFSDRFQSTGVQTSITLCWVVFALGSIAIGVAKKNAPLRYFALTLFGLSAFKLLVVDLSHLEAIWRVLSFIGVGVIFVAASWVYHRFVIGPEKTQTEELTTSDK